MTIVVGFLGIICVLTLIKSWRQIFRAPVKWESNNEPRAVEMIVEDINRARQRLLFYGGSGVTYNDPAILNALGNKKIPIEMIFQNEKVGSTNLADLAKSKDNIHLYYVKDDLGFRHFRVVDHDYVYIEKKHDLNTKKRDYKRLKNVRFLPGEYSKKFTKIRLESKAISG